jgi:mono/diheme cytochrome c family protein
LVRGEYPDALPEIAGTDGVSRPLFRRTWVRIVLGVLVIALVGLGIGLAIVLPAPLPRISPQLAARTPSVTHGAYLAIAGDCAACHTRPGGPAFAGGLPLNTPIGRVYSSNITSDFGHGMGRYTLPEFIRLMREGVARDGRRIYPAMPYTAYTRITDADLQDLHAYFTRAVAPVAEGQRYSLAAEHPLATRLLEQGVSRRPPVRTDCWPVDRVEPWRLPDRGTRPLRNVPHAARDRLQRESDARRWSCLSCGLCPRRPVAVQPAQ